MDYHEDIEVVFDCHCMGIRSLTRDEIFVRWDGSMYRLQNDGEIDVEVIDIMDALEVE